LARLTLFEKGVSFERRTVDIMEKAEPFEPWYTARRLLMCRFSYADQSHQVDQLWGFSGPIRGAFAVVTATSKLPGKATA